MLPMVGGKAESSNSTDGKIDSGAQARRQQQTCEQCKAASSRLDSTLSHLCRSDGEKHSASAQLDSPSRLKLLFSARSPKSWRITYSTGTSCTLISLTSQASSSSRQVSVTFARGTFSCTETGVCSVTSPKRERSRVASFSKVRLRILYPEKRSTISSSGPSKKILPWSITSTRWHNSSISCM